MYIEELQELGLNPAQAKIYATLIKEPGSKPSELAKKTGVGRQNTYKILDELAKMNLAEKKLSPKNKKAAVRFSPLPISNYRSKLQEEQSKLDISFKKLEVIEKDLDQIINSQAVNLKSNKPGIFYFENEAYINDLISKDMYRSTTEVYTYANFLDKNEKKDRGLAERNEILRKERNKRSIKKKIIFFNSPGAENFAKDQQARNTSYKIMQTKRKKHLWSALHIYAGKVVYVFVSYPEKNRNVSNIVIRDKSIYEFHKNLFEENWSSLPPLD